MIHYMNLQNSPFELIKKGDKTIEMRLNDEKRRLVKVGDVIQFKNIVSDEIINCNVINLYNYNTFNELYKNHDKKRLYCGRHNNYSMSFGCNRGSFYVLKQKNL